MKPNWPFIRIQIIITGLFYCAYGYSDQITVYNKARNPMKAMIYYVDGKKNMTPTTKEVAWIWPDKSEKMERPARKLLQDRELYADESQDRVKFAYSQKYNAQHGGTVPAHRNIGQMQGTEFYIVTSKNNPQSVEILNKKEWDKNQAQYEKEEQVRRQQQNAAGEADAKGWEKRAEEMRGQNAGAWSDR